ncbi:hypothetical protein OBBRIDRAFT_787338 [Obba rivulosa]|uniref:RING-type domain-containing protein n=1 Tax=Obba rivulosa TaxID=1052685 RepID=A0A8E2J763_9APHY|nr:hypothetical protein OBBRIDRAFT_787338 [Obba rivulosa]
MIDRPSTPATRSSINKSVTSLRRRDVPARVATAKPASAPHTGSTQGASENPASQNDKSDMVPRSEMEARIRQLEEVAKLRMDELDKLAASHRQRQDKDRSSLTKREKDLERLDKEVKRKVEKLDKREEALNKREKEANELLLSLSIERGERALAKLDSQFQCSLCMDVMAAPYILVPELCGHSYCALCILALFFGKFHEECKSFHKELDCPMCRAALPYPKLHKSRADCACPFTPNRLADEVIQELVDTVTASAQELYNISRANKANKHGGTLAIPESPIADWREKGRAKIAWKARQDQGKAEIQLLTKSWKTFRGKNLLAMKRRLGIAVMREEDL